MCDLNVDQETVEDVQIVTTILSTTWYTPQGISPHDSKILHSYWRALALIKDEMPLYQASNGVQTSSNPARAANNIDRAYRTQV